MGSINVLERLLRREGRGKRRLVLGSTQKRPIPVQRIREFGQSTIGFCELAVGEVEMFVLARVVGG